ncbi:ParB-like protein [Novosphingobium lentum]|uniref:ParB-like protein n=1 Tax=Novosphingobium lentum TaxID=145287 RepID=UPI001FE0A582|nr:ParB-like protein [Novosphingobium lentum]
MTMRPNVEPQLHPARLMDLRPTQMTVGMAEVARKRSQWTAHAKTDGGLFLGEHMIPVVIGPRKRPWLIDHHHLALALHHEGVEHVLISVVARLDHLKKPQFLTFMDNCNWLHTFDASGERREYGALPRKLTGLGDDPYRSLAGEVRRAGGYAKNLTPYSEFLWADFFRHRVSHKRAAMLEPATVADAVTLARSPSARHLPGWSGADAD